MVYYVYVLKTTKCRKVYIGVTNDPKRRLKQHKSVENLMWKQLTCCGRAVKRYGANTFTMVLKGAFKTQKEAAEFECTLIKRFGKKRLWNSSTGAEGNYGAARRENRKEVCGRVQ